MSKFRNCQRAFVVRIGLATATAVSIVLLLQPVLEAAAPPAKFGIDEILSGASERLNKIHSIEVATTVRWKKLLDVPSLQNVSDLPDKTVQRIKGDLRYQQIIPLEEIKRRLASTRVYDGKLTVRRESRVAREGYLVPAQITIMLGKVKADSFDIYCLEVLGMPITDRAKKQYDDGFFYPHCIRRRKENNGKSYYSVLPEQEMVDGAWCHVLESPGFDKIWVDSAIGFAIRKRERLWGPNEPSLFFRGIHREFREVQPGVWVPLKYRREEGVEPGDGEDVQGQLRLTMDLEVSDIKVNQVKDSDFVVDVPAGVRVLDTRVPQEKREERLYRVKSEKDKLFEEKIVRFSAFAADPPTTCGE